MKIIINIIFSIIIWASTGYTLMRTVFQRPQGSLRRCDNRREVVGVMLFALLLRLAVYAVSVLFTCQLYGQLSLDAFLDCWTRWDANNYIRIAEGWYTGYTENGDYITLVFFPLYSMLSRVLMLVIPNVRLSLMVTSTLSFAVGCGYLYRLVRIDYGEETAVNTVVWISVFPFAFFFGAIMTESVFFMTTAMTFYYIRRHKWLLAGIFGALSALSRMIGVFIIVPAVIEWLDFYKPFSRGRYKLKRLIKQLLPVSLIVVGIAVYLLINYSITGNPFMFMKFQQLYWDHTGCYFGSTIADVFDYALRWDTDIMSRVSIWLPEMIIFTLTAIALIYAAHTARCMYAIYLAGYMVINCSVTWLISGARYMSAAIPLFIILADIKNKKILPIVYVLSFGLMLFYMYRYLANMQVM